MPRTPLDPNLIHRAASVARDGELLARLCALAAPAARALVGPALVRETASTGAAAWIHDARAALRGLLASPDALDGLDTSALDAALAGELAQAVPPPDEAEVAERAEGAARAVVGAWLDALDAALAEGGAVALDGELLPRANADAARAALAEAGAPFALDGAEARRVLAAVRDGAFGADATIELPLGLTLARDARGEHTARRAVRAQQTAELPSDIAHSGEQRRGGETSEPTPLPAPSRSPRKR